MCRLMWTLNDESGGIGWGAPETMAEAMACHPHIAEEYVCILLFYIREDGNFLEYEPIRPYLEADDQLSRKLSAQALRMLGMERPVF